MKILIINGPNLNMLGLREPDIYGFETLEMINQNLVTKFENVDFIFFQSNHEGMIIDEIQKHYLQIDAIIINPAAYTHTSIGILDALKLHQVKKIEVHLSDIKSREKFRETSITSLACDQIIYGHGSHGYTMAVEAVINN